MTVASDYIGREWWCCAGGGERSERKFDPPGLLWAVVLIL